MKGNAGTLYLTRAPKTGVVMPIITRRLKQKILQNHKNNLLESSIFLCFKKQVINSSIRMKFSNAGKMYIAFCKLKKVGKKIELKRATGIVFNRLKNVEFKVGRYM